MTANNSRPPWDASRLAWATSHGRCWPMEITPTGAVSKPMAALEVDCVGSLRKGGAEKDNTGRGRFTTAVFVYDPEQDPAHVRETSLCATKDDTRTSRATSSTAMKPALRTARTAR